MSTTAPPQNCRPLLIIAACHEVQGLNISSAQSAGNLAGQTNNAKNEPHHEGELVLPRDLPVDDALGAHEPLSAVAVDQRLDRILFLLPLFALALLDVHDNVVGPGDTDGRLAVGPGAAHAENLSGGQARR